MTIGTDFCRIFRAPTGQQILARVALNDDGLSQVVITVRLPVSSAIVDITLGPYAKEQAAFDVLHRLGPQQALALARAAMEYDAAGAP